VVEPGASARLALASGAVAEALEDSSAHSEGGHAERAYAYLLRAIATCEILPGAVLNERQEAARLGMSRTPFRQALHQLAKEGLVVTERNRAVRVSLLDPATISDYFVVREALEVELLRRIVEERLPVDFARLEALLAEMEQAVKGEDALGYLRADEEFHLTVCQAAGNRQALEVIRRAWIHINRTRYLERGEPSNLRGSLAEHRSILSSLRRRRADRAEAAVRAHMNRARGLLGDLVQNLPGVFVAHGR
jgi:DNA-binding GntR family transcriptional regulator